MRFYPECRNLLQFNIFDPYEVVCHFSSTRLGGVSSGEFASLNLGNFSDDDPVKIVENRSLLACRLSLEPQVLLTPHQIHSDNIILIDSSILQSSKTELAHKLYGYDASITQETDVFLCVTTADCVPILLFDPKNQAIAAIHAGWRGTSKRIVEKTVEKMKSVFGTRAVDLVAAIGPAIGIEHYKVGDEVGKAFADNGFKLRKPFAVKNRKTQKLHIDLKEINRQELLRLGIPKHRIEKTKYDTYKNQRLFFSARRQSIHSGRMLTGIMLRRSHFTTQ